MPVGRKRVRYEYGRYAEGGYLGYARGAGPANNEVAPGVSERHVVYEVVKFHVYALPLVRLARLLEPVSPCLVYDAKPVPDVRQILGRVEKRRVYGRRPLAAAENKERKLRLLPDYIVLYAEDVFSYRISAENRPRGRKKPPCLFKRYVYAAGNLAEYPVRKPRKRVLLEYRRLYPQKPRGQYSGARRITP